MSSIKSSDQLQKSHVAIDMYSDNNDLIVSMDLPGVSSSDVRVEIENGQLHIFGQRKVEKEDDHKDYYHQEIMYGSFDRLISLPPEINAAGMSYEIKDGVLTVIIPK